MPETTPVAAAVVETPAVATPATPAPVAEPPKPATDPEVERRAAALARAARIEANAFKAQQQLKTERATWQNEQAELIRKAKGFDELNRLSQESPTKYLEAAGLKFDDVSKDYLAATTGAGKSPVQLAREAAREELDAREKLRAEEASKREAAEKIQRDRATEAGANKQLQDLFTKDPARYEHSLDRGADAAAAEAWKLVKDFYADHQQVLDFTKACDAVELKEKNRIEAIWAKREAKRLEAEKPKAETKAASGSTKTRLEEQRPAVAASQPTTRNRPQRYDPLKAARELLAAHKAASDN